MAKVSFVVTPFLPEHQPALGVSSLAATLRAKGFSVEIHYLNLEYASRIGWNLNAFLSNAFPKEFLLGELIFSGALWEERASWQRIGAFISRVVSEPSFERMRGLVQGNDAGVPNSLEELMSCLEDLHHQAPSIIRDWAERISCEDTLAYGFTSTFQQNIASLALARELRGRVAPEITILFGGGNCEGQMGQALADAFPFISCVVSGEAEHVIGDLLARSGHPASRTGSTTHDRFIVGTPVVDMDALAEPEFTDYFAQLEGLASTLRPNLVAESSRGCWWGARSHCTFCGLNGSSMAFRSKSPGRLVEQLSNAQRRYGISEFMMADNIMDLKYLDTVMPLLAGAQDRVSLFYETKSNLKKPQLAMMAAAGVCWIQPGIESLSTSILRLMGKGVSALQNIQLLKWAKEFRIRVAWNVLYGFPGEPEREYCAMAALVPSLVHLPAPTGDCRITLDRFSPYHQDPAKHGMTSVRAAEAYEFAYPELRSAERDRIAYFFQFSYADGRQPKGYYGPLSKQIEHWRTCETQGAALELLENGGQLSVNDSRIGGERRVTPLDETDAALLRVLDSSTALEHAVSMLIDDGHEGPAVARSVAKARDERWIVEDNKAALSVVTDSREWNRVIDAKTLAQLRSFGLDADTL